ncbi:MAG: hypothetical protein M1816_004747 [Peltula sp. TS41687]|nr:MAG: hypothetical protein M1816_004747 [Peltula sp. TS41687]
MTTSLASLMLVPQSPLLPQICTPVQNKVVSGAYERDNLFDGRQYKDVVSGAGQNGMVQLVPVEVDAVVVVAAFPSPLTRFTSSSPFGDERLLVKAESESAGNQDWPALHRLLRSAFYD